MSEAFASWVAALRSGGRALARAAPALDGVLREAYRRLPATLHDTPTSFIRRYFRNAPTVRFIELGAHNGLGGDPIRELIVSDPRWKGILVEPNPAIFVELEETYRVLDRVRLKRAAASDAPGTQAFYSFIAPDDADPAEILDWWSEISSFNRDHLIRHLPPRMHGAIASTEVEVVTVQGLMAEFGLERLDLLVMDIEGHEDAILGSLGSLGSLGDLGRGPSVIMFEHKHMSPETLARCAQRFRDLGYGCKMYGRDAILHLSDRNGGGGHGSGR